MFHRSSRPIEEITIERLDAKTIRSVANRLGGAKSFEDFVYRESEMDALFTLADIAITTARAGTGPGHLDRANLGELALIRELIFKAHDLTHDNDVTNAVLNLEKAATIIDGVPELS